MGIGDMKTYCITLFRSYKGPVSSESDLLWEEVVELFLGGHTKLSDKLSLPAFNATRFKTLDQVIAEDRKGDFLDTRELQRYVRRTKANALQVEMLIIDYDGGLTLEEARERFKSYEYVGYTSFSHLADGKSHKFRLIFPFTKPIPAYTNTNIDGQVTDQGVFYDLTDSISRFARGCDPASYNGVQLFFSPSAPPDRFHLAESWRNEGDILDWSLWATNKESEYSSSTSSVAPKTNSNSRKLDPDQIFHFVKGEIAARDVSGRIQKVACPFHGDRKGTEFLVRHDSGVVSFTCKRCGTFSMSPIVELQPEVNIQSDNRIDIKSLLVIDPVEIARTDREEMGKILASVKKTILSDTGLNNPSRHQISGVRLHYQFKSHILYFPEGSGKSQLALSILSDPPSHYINMYSKKYRPQIIFSCKSWEQVIEQHASFAPKLNVIGRKAKIAWSFDGAIQRRFNIKVRRTPSAKFRPGSIKSEETLEEIIQTNPNLDEKFIRLTWRILSDTERFNTMATPDIISVECAEPALSSMEFFESLRDDPPAIIFTTFAQLRLIKAKNDNIPKNWIIWIDDPDVQELIDIKPVKESKAKSKKQMPVINGTTYDIRDEDQSLGFSFKEYKCIYTTTERLTVRKLEHIFKSRNEPYELHGERLNVSGGKITILGTEKVQKKYDALIPLITRRINVVTKNDLLLIANGIPAEFNHSTNKGRNDLDKRDILVEISHPHPSQVRTICDSMGIIFDSNRNEISKEMMLDEMHQAIGRNSGYRANGSECIVLVDKNQHKYLVSECGYAIDKTNSVIIDRIKNMTRLDKRITDTASPLVEMIEELLNNPHTYLADGRKIKPDINYVVTTITDPKKQEDYLIRLLIALTSYSKVRFDKQLPKDKQSLKIWELGYWIIEKFIPDDRLESVLTTYTGEISPLKTVQKQ